MTPPAPPATTPRKPLLHGKMLSNWMVEFKKMRPCKRNFIRDKDNLDKLECSIVQVGF